MANTVFANKIVEAKAKDLLTTAVNTRSLMAIDNTLAAENFTWYEELSVFCALQSSVDCPCHSFFMFKT